MRFVVRFALYAVGKAIRLTLGVEALAETIRSRMYSLCAALIMWNNTREDSRSSATSIPGSEKPSTSGVGLLQTSSDSRS